MAEPHVTAIGPVIHGVPWTSTSTVVPGSLVFNSSGTWDLADADAVTTYAQAICMDNYRVGSVVGAYISICFEALIEDLDAPYTAGAAYYLSSTAGQYTATRPVATSTSRLVQNVGVARSTSVLHFRINPPREFYDYQQVTTKIMGAEDEKVVVLDSGNFASFNYNANGDDGFLTAHVPENAISLAKVYLHCAEEAEASTVTFTLVVGSAIHAAQHDAVTADSSGTTANVTADLAPDDMGKFDVTDYFDATNIVRPGALLGINVNATLGGTDIGLIFGLTFVWRCV